MIKGYLLKIKGHYMNFQAGKTYEFDIKNSKDDFFENYFPFSRSINELVEVYSSRLQKRENVLFEIEVDEKDIKQGKARKITVVREIPHEEYSEIFKKASELIDGQGDFLFMGDEKWVSPDIKLEFSKDENLNRPFTFTFFNEKKQVVKKVFQSIPVMFEELIEKLKNVDNFRLLLYPNVFSLRFYHFRYATIREYFYNEDGRLHKTIDKFFTGELKSKKEYFYNNENQLVKVIESDAVRPKNKNGIFGLVREGTFALDFNNLEELIKPEDIEWQEDIITTYAYDKNGLLVEEIKTGSRSIQVIKKYDKQTGKIKSKEFPTQNDEAEKYFYRKDGSLSSINYYRRGNKISMESYDKDGCKTVIKPNLDDDSKKPYKEKWDKDGRLIFKTSYDGNSLKEENEYDQDGNLVFSKRDYSWFENSDITTIRYKVTESEKMADC